MSKPLRVVFKTMLLLLVASPALAQEGVTRYVRYSHAGQASYGLLEGDVIRELDGNTEAAHTARYEAGPVEPPARTAARIACTLRLQTRWIRRYAERNPDMREAAAAAAHEIANVASRMEKQEGFDRIDSGLRAQVRVWGEDGRSISAAFDRKNEHAP